MSKDTIQSFKFSGGGGNSRAPHPLYETLLEVNTGMQKYMYTWAGDEK